MPNRSDYQPLAQSAEEYADVASEAPSGARQKKPGRPGAIDLSKLDAAFKRYGASFMVIVFR